MLTGIAPADLKLVVNSAIGISTRIASVEGNMTVSNNEQEGKLPEHSTSDDGAGQLVEQKQAGEVRHEVNPEVINVVNNYFLQGDSKREIFLDNHLKDLPNLPPHLHSFRDPRHENLISELENHRILLLTSYKGKAAYAAAYSLALDDFFSSHKRSLFLNRRGHEESSDIDLLDLAEARLLDMAPQILLIEIDRSCALLDSLLDLGWGIIARVRDKLESCSSYLVFVVDEDLIHSGEAHIALPTYTVSHLNYLLSKDFADRAEEIERRLLAAIEGGGDHIDLQELQHRVADRLTKGAAAFDSFLLEIEEARNLPLIGDRKQWDVFISHASEDKEDLARPLAVLLREMGLTVWYDDFVLQLGDRIRRSIEQGLTEARFGVVLLSPNFFRKEWPQRELDGLLALEGDGGIILPVWHRLNINDIKRFSPILADRVGISTSKGLTSVADQIFSAVRGNKP